MSSRSEGLDAAAVVATLRRLTGALPPPSHCWVAYSGGLDSHVLLHALASRDYPGLHAIHVDHALHPDSLAWVDHCRRVCADLEVPYRSVCVDASPGQGESPEASARDARYAAFVGLMSPGDWLVTAQHRDDQMETVLLQLLRGAGPKGLAAMPESAPLGAGHQLRPLLDFDRRDLAGYAQRHDLEWLEDPSNGDTRFDRNYLRHEVIPVLRKRWPSAAQTVARSARLSAAAAEALSREAATDLASIRTTDGSTLPVLPLMALDGTRAREVLRQWLAERNAPTPSEHMLTRIIAELAAARPDASPVIPLGRNGSLRRFQGDIHWVAPLPSVQHWHLDWPDPNEPLELPLGLGTLDWVEPPSLSALLVAPRRGGERFRSGDARPNRALKDILREQGWPPWLRPHLPMVWNARGQVIAVPGITHGLRWLKSDGSSW
ncbi:MAG: tRNA lysidine(34) synthetase TilS [Gammaproteobacteria bacterium]|nr:tRNA lysidine(34) synthetase TilS [Gammaproteobacteria bacterium]MCP5135775.1 tRNA lysidine(34) synthetase TilS [Gammaproteobacteria bacterium]